MNNGYFLPLSIQALSAENDILVPQTPHELQELMNEPNAHSLFPKLSCFPVPDSAFKPVLVGPQGPLEFLPGETPCGIFAAALPQMFLDLGPSSMCFAQQESTPIG